jgi:hypothetical protein
MPKSVHWCSTNMSYSSKLPSSSRTAIRSRAVSLPLACWRFDPPLAAAKACLFPFLLQRFDHILHPTRAPC